MTSKIIELDAGNTAAEDAMSDREFVAEMRRRLGNPPGPTTNVRRRLRGVASHPDAAGAGLPS